MIRRILALGCVTSLPVMVVVTRLVGSVNRYYLWPFCMYVEFFITSLLILGLEPICMKNTGFH